MSKIRKPAKKTVELEPEARPSRIRRDPVRTGAQVEPKPRNREREMWLGVAGISAMGVACAALAIGVSAATSQLGPGAAAKAEAGPRFAHCYNAGGSDCVRDGDTLYLDGARVELAADAPEIADANCSDERSRGIEAAIRLRELLNSGEVTVAGTARDADGRLLTSIEVDGRDVGETMIAAGAARRYGNAGWC